MSKLRLTGSTSGFTELTAPAVAGSNTLTLPTGNGTAGQYLQTNGSGALSFATLPAGGYTFLAAGTVSGNASVTVTGIPTTAQQVIIPFQGISDDSSSGSKLRLRLGSGSIDTGSNYNYSIYAGIPNTSNTDPYYLVTSSQWTGAANAFDGLITLTRAGTGMWSITSIAGCADNGNGPTVGGGRWGGADTIDRIQLYSGNGTFDGGLFRVGYI